MNPLERFSRACIVPVVVLDNAEKGQIVVPKEVREMFGIRPGDTLLLLADVNRGIALQTFEKADPVFRDVFSDREQ